jgi:hypothetical protein
MNFKSAMTKILREPPFRLATKAAVSLFSDPVRRSLWDVSPRPQYLLGLITAAFQAKKQGISEITAIEFGVAGGNGLLAMQREAESVRKHLSVRVDVVGFDTGNGLTKPLPDYRDHPDIWGAGDYPMDVEMLRSKLNSSTELILGDLAETAQKWLLAEKHSPIGFISIDVDYYSSTRSALQVLRTGVANMLQHVPMYVDDIDMIYTHSKGGELYAIEEFNQNNTEVFIDQWRGVKGFRPFPEAPYLDRMFIAHDLKSIGECRTTGEKRQLGIKG